MSNTRRNHAIAWLDVARVCGWVAFLSLAACQAQNGGTDSGLTRCDASGVHAGCPCDGTVLTVCGLPGGGDLLCTNGTWVLAADVCGELDTGIHPTDAGPDANDVCGDEGAFTCGSGGGVVCCGGHRRSFSDGPCGLTFDAGADAGPCPYAFGCPCDPNADAGAAPCIGYTLAICTSGAWERGTHACGICSL
jgi:hypothetical protein